MSDSQSKSDAQPAQPTRPEPPPYRPNRALIGYIEKGQTPLVEARKRRK